MHNYDQAIVEAIRAKLAAAGVPQSDFDPDFVVRMINAMMVSFFKYGSVPDAKGKFDAIANVRTRMGKYRETHDRQFLVDAANFAMIEGLIPQFEDAHYGSNDADSSPGRVAVEGRRLVHETNKGERLLRQEM